MKELKLVNKTYQPFQIIINGSVCILRARGDFNSITIPFITPQIQNLLNKELVKISKVR